jgi:polyhydroxyalkanoate synthase
MKAPPMPRRGPRPLPLHLALAMLRAGAALGTAAIGMPLPGEPIRKRRSAAVSPSLNSAWPRSSAGRAEAARIAQALAAGGHPPEAFQAALLRSLARRDSALVAGIAAYRRHPFLRDPGPDRPVLWAEGAARLLDYGSAPGGRPALVIPSLINRAHVLDLLPEASMLGWLAGAGLRPMLLDWGWPGEVERGFTLTDVIAGRLERALAVACGVAGGAVVLIGYCMGGLLALAAALRQPGAVRALALLATPWDFWADGAARAQALAGWLPAFAPAMEATGALPVDAIQALFAGLDPFGVAEKYRGFGRLDPASARARRFVALEDWLNDGIPLPAAIAREALGGWYGRNTPARGAWRIAGLPVEPRGWAGPAFLAVPDRDRIVPPAAAAALGQALPQAVLHRPAAGHIGMVAGTSAEVALWRPLAEWVHGLPP